MPKIELDSFEHGIRQHAKIIKSTCQTATRKQKKEQVTQSLSLFFGIHRKQDNQFKTKQLNLF